MVKCIRDLMTSSVRLAFRISSDDFAIFFIINCDVVWFDTFPRPCGRDQAMSS